MVLCPHKSDPAQPTCILSHSSPPAAAPGSPSASATPLSQPSLFGPSARLSVHLCTHAVWRQDQTVKPPRALQPRLILKYTDSSRFQRRSQSASTRVRSGAQNSAVLRVEGCDTAPLSPLLPPRRGSAQVPSTTSSTAWDGESGGRPARAGSAAGVAPAARSACRHRVFVRCRSVHGYCFVWGSGGLCLFFCAASRVPACSCDQDVLFGVGSARLDAIFRE